MSEKKTRHAAGRIAVKTYEPMVFDEIPGGPTLSDIRVTETFSGDIEGEGIVHFVQAARSDGSASFVGIERVRGAIEGRKGTFLLQDSGTLVGKEVTGQWFVVPGSGTGDLVGLRGNGGVNARFRPPPPHLAPSRV